MRFKLFQITHTSEWRKIQPSQECTLQWRHVFLYTQLYCLYCSSPMAPSEVTKTGKYVICHCFLPIDTQLRYTLIHYYPASLHQQWFVTWTEVKTIPTIGTYIKVGKFESDDFSILSRDKPATSGAPLIWQTIMQSMAVKISMLLCKGFTTCLVWNVNKNISICISYSSVS